MQQPTKTQIFKKINLILDGKGSREEVCEWAFSYLSKDNIIAVSDIDAWHFLVAISNIDEMVAPDTYLYSIEDIKVIMKEYVS